MVDNLLYYGDNLDILRHYIKDETVDLIYLDPPFNSKATYNVLFGEQNGSRSAAQIKAFEDTWRWDQEAATAYQKVVECGGLVSQTMQAFRQLLGDNDMLAYLTMMAQRLVELRRVLKPIGSIYLHCDPTASHYLKILMDSIFGAKNFRNEIVWCYTSGGVPKRDFARKHDIIFRYSKTDKFEFNPQYRPYSPGTLERGLTKVKGPKYKLRKEGAVMQDWWVDLQKVLSPTAKETLGYPTQKPEALLERIVKAGSNEGDTILDPFCGCGTTIAVAQRLKRCWIGIDITHLAITLIKHRLRDAFGDKATYKVIGEPVSLPDAKTLAKQDPYQFQWWALGLVGARPVEQKKGSDKGIDGRIWFHDEGERGKTKQVILSVKAGHTNVAHIRDLRGVVEREKAEIGVLISMQNPTQPMRSEAAGAGSYYSPGWNQKYPKLQILTVAELLASKGIEMPPLRQVNKTFKKAPRAITQEGENTNLDL
ncbi:MAG: DNA methyltransferase [candidate division WOR-3 bacterium]|nr:DNA methyltransferase [candidate division WOR-3 bacterium]